MSRYTHWQYYRKLFKAFFRYHLLILLSIVLSKALANAFDSCLFSYSFSDLRVFPSFRSLHVFVMHLYNFGSVSGHPHLYLNFWSDGFISEFYTRKNVFFQKVLLPTALLVLFHRHLYRVWVMVPVSFQF